MRNPNRKKWTPKTEVTDTLLKFREKRKWQIALRRYILEQKWSAAYAPYFGIDIANFRKWIELQFDTDTNWENFSETWQFDHVVPVVYFDFDTDHDLRLCWNFTNIRVEKLTPSKNRGHRLDVLSAKTYFGTLYTQTNYPLCRQMVNKIEELEILQLENTDKLETFIRENEQYIQTISSFSDYEYLQLNEGVEISKILEERAFSAKIQPANSIIKT
jgi:hypothetical protein